jgi:glycosyltransferase involved in cell wall biosynthesis
VSSLLIVIPTFNEAENIGDLVTRLTTLYPDADALVVDDGSPDGTAAKVEALAVTNPRILVIKRSGKGGRGSAVLAGFTYGLGKTYTHFIEMDADFSHKPEEIASMLEKIKTCDMVIGSRYLPGSEIHAWGMKRTVFSYLANKFARFMLGIPMSDYTNGFRCYTRQAIEAIDMKKIDAKGYVVLSEVAMQLWKKGIIDWLAWCVPIGIYFFTHFR